MTQEERNPEAPDLPEERALEPRERRAQRRKSRRRLRRRPKPPSEWAQWPDEKLLRLRLCDLDVHIKDSPLLRNCIKQLRSELEAKGIRFRPYFWLSDEWFCPDGVPGIAVPFYLAHPRLARLEENQILEVEGGTPEWCMRILRHETGHAIENAYRLRRRRRRIELFGKSSTPYPEAYTPRPYSRSYVLHLEAGYAQAHPDEDFAETFAVWLTPDSQWQKRYAGWPVLRKLEYVDELMKEIGPLDPPVRTRTEVDPLRSLRKTLAQHYAEKRARYGLDQQAFYDRDLRRLFSDSPEFAKNPTAASFILRHRKEFRRKVARWTGAYQYTINEVLKEIIERCRALGLRLATPEEQAKLDFLVFLTVQTTNYLHSGLQRVWI
ncbi:MAG: hypothetical protein KatS3mg076_1986 [Candidatus Binatia bacterium]|nr:MAG: hypothetical protein KatS3mg076_1986 [Candidatus Binatia bacterium]